MRAFAPAALGVALATAPALADTICNFTLECYMTEPCAGAGWELTLDREAGVLSTVFGDLEILHVEEGDATQIAARGDGSLNLLTIGEELSLFTTQTGDGPATISYVGECFPE